MTRARIEFAIGQNAALYDQVKFADAKAATLLTLIGLLAAFVSGGGIDASTPATAVLLALNALVIALCLLVLTPRLPGPQERARLARTDRFSWTALTCTGYTAEDHAAFLRRAQASQLIVSIARSNSAVARVLMRKFTLLRFAFAAAGLDVAATLAAAALPRM